MARRTFRAKIHDVFEQSVMGDSVSRLVHSALITLIILNIIAVVLESVPVLNAQYHRLFVVIELVAIVTFTFEYILRVWSSIESVPLKPLGALKGRLKYMVSAPALIDLLAIAPLFLDLFFVTDVRTFLIFRLLRFLKLARYSTGMVSLMEAIYSERNSLFACLVILTGTILVAASLMHMAESVAQPEKFGTIPDAMWWAVITLSTVGYGDVVPITPLGKILAAFTAMAGLVMIALPVGIIASAFSREISKRDFVVTYGMVAKVPLFAGLDAGSISEIMKMLKSRMAQKGEIICRRGEVATSIFFLTEGQVSAHTGDKRTLIETGEFISENILDEKALRHATVRAMTRVKLLELAAEDVRHLIQTDNAFKQKLEAVHMARDIAAKAFIKP
jgi:voltage-gated potassium channel